MRLKKQLALRQRDRMRHHMPDILQLDAGCADERVLDPANGFANDMEIMMDQQIDTKQNRTCERVLYGYNPVLRSPSEHGREHLFQARTRKQLCVRS